MLKKGREVDGSPRSSPQLTETALGFMQQMQANTYHTRRDVFCLDNARVVQKRPRYKESSILYIRVLPAPRSYAQTTNTFRQAHSPAFLSRIRSTCLIGCNNMAGKHILPSPCPSTVGLELNSHSSPPSPSTLYPNHLRQRFAENTAS